MAYKTFVNGFPLNASELNNNFMNQVISTFADASARSTAIAAPVEGQITYLTGTNDYWKWDGSAWVELEALSPDFTATSSPNYIINGAFDINQRQFTSTTATGTFTFDRWYTRAGGDGTGTFSAQAFSPADLSVEGFGESANHIRIVTSGSTSTDTLFAYRHNIEDVRTLAGQTVTISFWAKAASGTPKIAIPITQIFGSGGSPAVITPAVSAITISTSWARYSQTITIPSVSGKTIGSGSYFLPSIAVSAGSDFDADHSSIGIQNNTFDIWGVQLEAGSVVTPFKRNAPSLEGELAACQRYYQKHNFASTEDGLVYGAGYGTGDANFIFPLMVEMRVAPSAAFVGTLSVIEPGYGIKTFASVTNIVCGKKTGRFEGITVSPAGSLTVGLPLNASVGTLTLSAEL